MAHCTFELSSIVGLDYIGLLSARPQPSIQSLLQLACLCTLVGILCLTSIETDSEGSSITSILDRSFRLRKMSKEHPYELLPQRGASARVRNRGPKLLRSA